MLSEEVRLCNLCIFYLYTVDLRETGMFSNHKLCMYFFHEKCLQLQPNDEPFPFTLSRFDKNIASHYLKKKSNKNNTIRKHNMRIYQIQVVKCSVCTLHIFEYYNKNNNKKFKTTVKTNAGEICFGQIELRVQPKCGISWLFATTRLLKIWTLNCLHHRSMSPKNKGD